MGRSAALAERIGRDEVYRSHLARIIEPLAADGLDVLFWGDQFRRDPAAVEWIPDGTTWCPRRLARPPSSMRVGCQPAGASATGRW
jgi:hypothetical protein